MFRVTLPNRNYSERDPVQKEKGPVQAPDVQTALRNQKQIIYDYARENGQVTRKEVEDLLDAGTTKVFRLLRELCEEGRMEQSGTGKLSKYLTK